MLAEVALRNAIAVAGSRVPRELSGGLAWADLLRLRHARGEDVDGLAAQAADEYPDNWELVWARARIAIDRGRDAEALGLLERLCSVDPNALPETIAYDVRIFGSLAHGHRGLCLFRMGRYAAAASAYQAAERLDPGNLELRAKRRLAEVRAACGPDAVPEGSIGASGARPGRRLGSPVPCARPPHASS